MMLKNQSMKNKLFEFLDAQNFTLKEAEDLNFILNKIGDFEAHTGAELEEEEAIKWGMDYSVYYKKSLKKSC